MSVKQELDSFDGRSDKDHVGRQGQRGRQDLFDRVVDTVLAGSKLGQHDEALLEYLAPNMPEMIADPIGHLIPAEQIPEDGEELATLVDLESLADRISLERLDELQAGAAPNAAETARLREIWIEGVLEKPDDDMHPGLWEAELCHRDGRSVVAIVLCRGYSFSGVRRTLVGVWPDIDAGIAELTADGSRHTAV